MKNFDEILENLEAQKKQVETQFIKIEGAIEIVNSMKKEKEESENKEAEAQKVPVKKK